MSADQRTHEKISAHLCGRAVELGAGHAKVADYAEMLAVHEPTLVLANAIAKFLGPVVVGDRLEAEATVEQEIRTGAIVVPQLL